MNELLRIFRSLIVLFSLGGLWACATSPPKTIPGLTSFSQYDKTIHLTEPPQYAATNTDPTIRIGNERRLREIEKRKKRTRLKSENKPLTETTSHRLPDPFRPGEKVVLDARYMGTAVGDLTMETLPFADVNSTKAYKFSTRLRSNKTFSLFYFIDDTTELYLDAERLVPLTFSVHAEEKNKRQEIRTIYHWDTHEGEQWENRSEKDGKLTQARTKWKLPDSSQNLLSAIYYMRTFKLEPGSTLHFPVTHDDKVYDFSIETLRREALQTKVGTIPTLVVRANVPLNGLFKSKGDTLFWLTDDDRKLLVQVEAEISIGKVTAQVKEISR